MGGEAYRRKVQERYQLCKTAGLGGFKSEFSQVHFGTGQSVSFDEEETGTTARA